MIDLIEALFDLFTPWSRRGGPLRARAERKGERLAITLTNEGRKELGFAAVRARDAAGRQSFPAVDLAVRTPLPPGRSESLSIALAELRALDCARLEVLDTSGHAWPVDGF